MGGNVNNSPEDNCPGGSLVEGNVLVEGNDVVQGCPAQQGDEVPAYREQYEGDIHVEDEGGSPSDSWWSVGTWESAAGESLVNPISTFYT